MKQQKEFPLLLTALGHYRVESELGAGGMGVVYLATDTRLDRPVAIKILNEATLQAPDARARFEREARLLASLNHTNIAAVHGLEQAGEVSFLVLEYVPGETLAERLARGALPLPEALTIARQIAEALEAAHVRGIVHRDLKPANIKVTDDGQVKVLDFGLAKALEPVDVAPRSEAGTMTAPAALTRDGILMGTLPYMSPEQASGRSVDQRTDIWAFGCVLYEMMTGVRTFAGDTTTDVLVRVLDRDPDWTKLPAETPNAIRNLLRRCLTKDPRCRLHHAADARLELDDALAGRTETAAVLPGARAGSVTRLLAGAAAGVLLSAILAAIWISTRDGRPAVKDPVRFTIDLPADAPQILGWASSITFSRDGKTLLYPIRSEMYARRLDQVDATRLEGLANTSEPVYSPDGQWLLLEDRSQASLVKVALGGGGARIPITPVDFYFRGDWGADGYVYGNNHLIEGIFRAPDGGGEKEWITTLDPARQERGHRFARLLPGDKGLLVTVVSGDTESFDDARIDVVDLATRKRTTLVQGGTYPRYSPSGHLVYARAGSLYALPLDVATLRVSGTPVKVADRVLMSRLVGTAYFDVSSTGDLVYAEGPSESGLRTLHWVDRQGKETPIDVPARWYLNPRLSPDATQLAVEIEGPNHDFYVHDFSRGVTSRITNDGASHAPIWTHDGRRIAYRTNKFGAMTMSWMPADRSAPEERLVNFQAWQSAVSFSPDGKYLAFDQYDYTSTAGGDIWVLPLEGDRRPRPFVEGRFPAGAAKFSPDGRWLLYSSMESGRAEIYVQGWPSGPKKQLSGDGGTDPLWRRDGKEIFYRNGREMVAVPVTIGETVTAGRPQVLWTGDYTHGLSSSCGWRGTSRTSYDVSPDGQRFLMIKANEQGLFATRIVVVVNWGEELRQIVAAAGGR